jgi:glycosylphosphatidylinositol transamidase (GPIT) subunit GPI8
MNVVCMDVKVDQIDLKNLEDVFIFALEHFDIKSKVTMQLFKSSYGMTVHGEKYGVNGVALRRGKDFVIQVNVSNRSITEMAMTIFHEVTHVMQFEKKFLEIDRSIPYAERWWEKEAFANERVLLETYIERITANV